MTMNHRIALATAIAALGLAAFSSGCSGTNGGAPPDAGSPKEAGETCSNGNCAAGRDGGGARCTPNAQQCATSKIAEVCNAAGNAWVPAPCTASETCTHGACSAVAADASPLPPACSAGTVECVTSTLVRVCPADGSGWLAVQCATGQTCSHGTCAVELDAPCTPGAGSCLGATTGFQCNAAGTAYAPLTCPANTTCNANGGKIHCTGATTVGATQCDGMSFIQTSPDGFTWTTAACPVDTYCVATGSNTAACLKGGCTPDPYGCNSVCGDKVNPSDGAEDDSYLSTCTETPTGYQWSASQCAAPQFCSYPQGTCGPNNVPNPSCGTTCTEGTTHCALDGSGLQTCAHDVWSAAVACDPTSGRVCMNLSGNNDPNAIGYCGDPVCFQSNGKGTCTAGGQILGCDSAYHLEAMPTSCPAGTTCQETNNGGPSVGGYSPGACIQTCTPGATQCSSGQIETCTAGGIWGDAAACTGGTSCQPHTSANGEPAAICGACSPGTHACAAVNGGPANTGIETCSATGAWGAAAACQVGVCENDGHDNACLAECAPNAGVCGGIGNTQVAPCSAQGVLPTANFTNCPNDAQGQPQSCRVDSSNQSLGCLTCLGPNHGLPPDTICSTGTPGMTGISGIDTCGANDTWALPVACPNATTCSPLGACTCGMAVFMDGNFAMTQTTLEREFAMTCNQWFGTGGPVGCGAYSDCCSAYTQYSGPAVPTCH